MPDFIVHPTVTSKQLYDMANGDRAWATPVSIPCKQTDSGHLTIGIMLDVKDGPECVSRLDLPLTRLFPAWSKMTIPARFKNVRAKLEEAEAAVEWLEGRINHEPDDSLHVGKMILSLSTMNMIAGELWSALVRLGDQDPVLGVQLVEMSHERQQNEGDE